MSITTEQAEQMAEICDQLGGFAQCAAALRSLAAERDDLAKRLKDAERERNHQHGRADRNAAQYAAEQAKREQLQAENEKLRAALRELIYETTHLSPQEDDGSHRCTITGETLRKARMALLALGEKE
jgi:chromosome segregation ATPase